MDPARWTATAGSSGLPRTRGDGPRLARVVAPRDAASPHTRGWTRVTTTAPANAEGFPAHAGMDPAASRRSQTRGRLPRTRGDGPVARLGHGARTEASPHTRGWTRSSSSRATAQPGFPAHAGMDRRTPSGPARRWRLPRTRGDGPWSGVGSPCLYRASPHTRGWTRWQLRVVAEEVGFPAHAGMDRSRTRSAACTMRLPRTRGDGPDHVKPSSSRIGASPHTRGWTRRDLLLGVRPRGFPAHAGMDPTRRTARATWPRLPRTRGDGPGVFLLVLADAEASPHTRGWTPSLPRARRGTRGFPAHAGMDPEPRPAPQGRGRLPRTRGDGPSPASRSANVITASPHTRGWTLREHRPDHRAAGFPAHAGMDPRLNRSPPSGCGLPRTRGDGPDSGTGVLPQDAASPHTRGWTRW